MTAFAEGLAAAEAIEVDVGPGRPSGELPPASRISGVVTDGRDAIGGATVSLGFGHWSNGRVDPTLTAGQDATCEVPVVKANPDAPLLPIGAAIEPGVMPARFGLVDPKGAADRAGDVIRAGDGANVT